MASSDPNMLDAATAIAAGNPDGALDIIDFGVRSALAPDDPAEATTVTEGVIAAMRIFVLAAMLAQRVTDQRLGQRGSR
jgi:hypothetical protein